MGAKESLSINTTGGKEAGFSYIYERTISFLEKEACLSTVVIPEGPPIYIWPDDRYSTQRWDGSSFNIGWQLINDIATRLSSKTYHFFLIDELNNRPPFVEESEVNGILNQIARTSSALLNSSLLQRDDDRERIRRYKESDFVRNDSSNRCSNLDASFQREKLLFFTEHFPEITFENFKHLLLIVAHPIAFQQQQALMLSALLGEMKNPPFNQLPRQQRRSIISSIYRHVWIDENGGIDSMTIPVWNGSKFIFTSLSL